MSESASRPANFFALALVQRFQRQVSTAMLTVAEGQSHLKKAKIVQTKENHIRKSMTK